MLNRILIIFCSGGHIQSWGILCLGCCFPAKAYHSSSPSGSSGRQNAHSSGLRILLALGTLSTNPKMCYIKCEQVSLLSIISKVTLFSSINLKINHQIRNHHAQRQMQWRVTELDSTNSKSIIISHNHNKILQVKKKKVGCSVFLCILSVCSEVK